MFALCWNDSKKYGVICNQGSFKKKVITRKDLIYHVKSRFLEDCKIALGTPSMTGLFDVYMTSSVMMLYTNHV